MIIYVQPTQRRRRGWHPSPSPDVPASYRVEATRGSTDSSLIRRWYTDDVTRVPWNAHPRYVIGRDGQHRLIGFDELMCQHSGDFADCMSNAELTRLGIDD
jgi:hypothetical protein